MISATDGQTQDFVGGVKATIGDTRWSADSRFLFGQLLEGNQMSLAKIDRETGAIKRLARRVSICLLGTATASTTRQVVLWPEGLTINSPDLWLIDEEQASQQLTHLNPQFDEIRFGDVREVQWRNPDDGQPVHGFIVLPLDYRKVAVTRW